MCGFWVVWQGAMRRMAAPCNEEQRGQATQKPCDRVRSVLTQWVNQRVTRKLNTHTVLQTFASGQLRFLGLLTLPAQRLGQVGQKLRQFARHQAEVGGEQIVGVLCLTLGIFLQQVKEGKTLHLQLLGQDK